MGSQESRAASGPCAADFAGWLAGADGRARGRCLEARGPIAETVTVAGRYAIKRHVMIPTFAALWWAGRRLERPRLAEAGAVGVLGIVGTALLSEAVKRSLCRDRPEDGRDPTAWGVAGGTSFPSGHAGTAFAAATAVAVTTDGPGPAILAYAAAAVLSYGRVLADRHWATDVVVGAALGTGVALAVAKQVGRRPALDPLPHPLEASTDMPG
jgi:undecaprenyl-diphosphatase